MKTFLNYLTAFLFISLTIACSSDDNIDDYDSSIDQPGALDLTFSTMVDNEEFTLNKAYTINETPVSFKQFRYWVSNISLTTSSGEQAVIPDSYFLIEETDAISIQDGAYEYPARKRQTINMENIPSGDYDEIVFSIGVDSTYNNNLSLHAGELSQLNGMTNISWMWHTSYIFSSIKGINMSDDTELILETGLNSSYRTVTIPLNQPMRINSSNKESVNLKVDLTALMNGLKLDETPTIGAATPEAMEIMADNYSNSVFTLYEDNGEE